MTPHLTDDGVANVPDDLGPVSRESLAAAVREFAQRISDLRASMQQMAAYISKLRGELAARRRQAAEGGEVTDSQVSEERLRWIERVRTSITHHSVGVAHLLMAYDEARKEREEYRAVVARQIEDKRRLLAERNEARAVCSLVAGNLAAWADKREEAPESAQEHLDEAMHALVRFRPDGGYSEAASKLRLEMWHGEVYAERDAARAESDELRRQLDRIIAVAVKVTNTMPRSCGSDQRELDHYDACGDLAQEFMSVVEARATKSGDEEKP